MAPGERGNMSFFDKEAQNKKNTDEAEKELEEALEAERPEDLAPKEENNKEGAESQEENAETASEVEETPQPKNEHNWEKRYNDLRSWVDKKLRPEYKGQIDDLKGEIDSLKDQMSSMSAQAAPADMPQTAEDIETLKNDNPAAYNAITTMARNIAEEIVKDKTKNFQKDIDALNAYRAETAEQAAFVDLAGRFVEFGLDVPLMAQGGDESFNAWADTKSKRFLSPLYDSKEDVEAAADVLTAYIKETGISRRKPKTAATTVKDGGGAPDIPKGDKGYDFLESQIQNMSDKELEKNMEAIEEADRKGRIIYDLTKPLEAQRKLGAVAA